MNREFTFTATKTYANQENARKAIAKFGFQDVRHFMMQNEEGRWFPVFIGQEAAHRGIHFHFNIVG